MNAVIEVVTKSSRYIKVDVENLGQAVNIRNAIRKSGEENPFEDMTDVLTRAKEIAGEKFTGADSSMADVVTIEFGEVSAN